MQLHDGATVTSIFPATEEGREVLYAKNKACLKISKKSKNIASFIVKLRKSEVLQRKLNNNLVFNCFHFHTCS